MAGPRRWALGWVLKIEPSGEKFEHYHLFTTDQGYQIALRRRSTKATAKADFWDWAEFYIETPVSTETLGFLTQYRLIQRAEFLGHNFEALQSAAQWARLLIRNLRWIEDFKITEVITRSFLEALQAGALPELVLFKAIYKFAASEGFAVKAGWWAQLPKPTRTAAAALLSNPAQGAAHADLHHLSALYKSLSQWLTHHSSIEL